MWSRTCMLSISLAFCLLACNSQEATYNPYYTLILSHLCANSYDHRFTFQYALWDFMRELENGSKVSKEKLGNVARAVGYVVARGGLSLTVFKVSSFHLSLLFKYADRRSRRLISHPFPNRSLNSLSPSWYILS